MASASKTPNLNLPQWVGTEKPERTDFNAAFDAIDTNLNLVQSAIGSLEVIKTGASTGVVISHTVLNGEIYLLVVGRDNGLYFITGFSTAAYLTTVVAMGGTAGTISVSGDTLTVDFATRTRPYVLLKLA